MEFVAQRVAAAAGAVFAAAVEVNPPLDGAFVEFWCGLCSPLAEHPEGLRFFDPVGSGGGKAEVPTALVAKVLPLKCGNFRG